MPCKDTNLKAIHNMFWKVTKFQVDVLCHAKIQIWKQFTTWIWFRWLCRGMCCAMQRYKFESNSQHCEECYSQRRKMCCAMQRYKFESNSQPAFLRAGAAIWCVVPCKDTNLKAIHNWKASRYSQPSDVLCHAKIQIWKQFTTTSTPWSRHHWMCCAMQRYKFESNSQLANWQPPYPRWCVVPCKDTNLKAIHNTCTSWLPGSLDVLCHAKIQIWKQFTTRWKGKPRSSTMCCAMQRYKFESNSQPTNRSHILCQGCVVPCKDTNLKAIHNPGAASDRTSAWCVVPCKDTNLKAIHNGKGRAHPASLRCVVPCKDTNLKAIHNDEWYRPLDAVDVLCHAKIQIWKQFTTLESIFL